MAHKTLRRFCTKLHRVETTMQSLANDGLCALSGARDQPGRQNIEKLEEMLRKPVEDLPSPWAAATLESIHRQEWPVLVSLRRLAEGAPSPPPSELRRLAGELQLQGRWYGLQRCFVVLTADRWLYCFRREEDADPQWSICVSSSSVR